MAKKETMTSQLNSKNTFIYYRDIMCNLAANVFIFENLPDSCDPLFINNKLLANGSIAFFVDDVTLELMALPYQIIGKLDPYSRPNRIQCYGSNGYRSKKLNRSEFVIMYDNTAMLPLIYKIWLLAQRISKIQRTIDININQQKTPRIWKATNNNLLSIRKFLADVEKFEDSIITYNEMDLDDIEAIVAPAPFVADKLDEISKKNIWAEFCQLIGISMIDNEKKERLITDEIEKAQGGYVVGRYSRFLPRKRAVDEINKKFSEYLQDPIELYCYDDYRLFEKADSGILELEKGSGFLEKGADENEL